MSMGFPRASGIEMWALQFTLLCLIERPNRTEKAKKGIIGITACIFFSSIHQKMTMDLDRTNRLFYKNVIINEKRKKDYQELDSLIYSNSFFKTYWTLEH